MKRRTALDELQEITEDLITVFKTANKGNMTEIIGCIFNKFKHITNWEQIYANDLNRIIAKDAQTQIEHFLENHHPDVLKAYERYKDKE